MEDPFHGTAGLVCGAGINVDAVGVTWPEVEGKEGLKNSRLRQEIFYLSLCGVEIVWLFLSSHLYNAYCICDITYTQYFYEGHRFKEQFILAVVSI